MLICFNKLFIFAEQINVTFSTIFLHFISKRKRQHTKIPSFYFTKLFLLILNLFRLQYIKQHLKLICCNQICYNCFYLLNKSIPFLLCNCHAKSTREPLQKSHRENHQRESEQHRAKKNSCENVGIFSTLGNRK